MSEKTTRFFDAAAVTRADEDEEGQRSTVTTVIASTASVDRMGDVVEQSWDLERFRANPVILWGHDASRPPVGRATRVEVRDNRLEMDIHWDEDETNALGRQVAAQFRNGFLSAVSVGFRPGKVTPRSSLPEDDPRFGKAGAVLSENELLETSAVTIPANADALAISRDFVLTELTELVDRKLADARVEVTTDAILEAIRTRPEVRAAVEGLILASSPPSDEERGWWLAEAARHPEDGGWWLRGDESEDEDPPQAGAAHWFLAET